MLLALSDYTLSLALPKYSLLVSGRVIAVPQRLLDGSCEASRLELLSAVALHVLPVRHVDGAVLQSPPTPHHHSASLLPCLPIQHRSPMSSLHFR